MEEIVLLEELQEVKVTKGRFPFKDSKEAKKPPLR
jgi:hypothetical protein